MIIEPIIKKIKNGKVSSFGTGLGVVYHSDHERYHFNFDDGSNIEVDLGSTPYFLLGWYYSIKVNGCELINTCNPFIKPWIMSTVRNKIKELLKNELKV